MAKDLLDVHAPHGCDAAAVPWRNAAGPRLTVVAQLAFPLQEGIAEQLLPAPGLAPDDVHVARDPARSLEAVCDLVPALLRPEVLVVGSAHAPPGVSTAGVTAQIQIARGAVLLRKRLHVLGERGPGAAEPAPFRRIPIAWERAVRTVDNPAGRDPAIQPANWIDPAAPHREAGFGPVPAAWPARSRRRASSPGSRLTGAVPEILGDFDWSALQAAPEDQQLDALIGDEWVALDALHPTHPRITFQLPRAQLVARLLDPRGQVLLEGPMSLDRLTIDTDRQRVTLAGRAILVADAHGLAGHRVEVGLGVPGDDVVFPDVDDEHTRRKPLDLARLRGVSTTASAPSHWGFEDPSETFGGPPREGTSRRVIATSDERPGGSWEFDAPPAATVGIDLAALSSAALPFAHGGPGAPARAAPSTALDGFDEDGAETVQRDLGRARDSDAPGTLAVDASAFLQGLVVPFAHPPAPVAPPPVSAPFGMGAGPPGDDDEPNRTRGVDIHALMARGSVPFAGVPSEGAPTSARGGSREATPFALRPADVADPMRPAVPAAAVEGRLGEVVPARSDARAAVVTFTWQLQPPQDVLVVVAKASFAIEHGARATALDEAELPVGDLFADDDVTGTLVQASDLAVLKRAVDVLVRGHVYAPGGRATAMQAAVRLRKGAFRFSRELAVFGDRTWKGGGLAPSDPAPFDVIPLVWERSFGGPEHEDNPAGVGFRGARARDGRGAALPNFEEPGQLIRAPDHTPRPAGLGAVNPLWPQRWRRLGTYDVAWSKTRWPWFAADLDLDFFQAAPAPQRVPRLDGDEDFELVGLHPERGALRGSLPGVRMRAFAWKAKDAGGGVVEVPLRLDTVTFDPDRDRVHLVWRGRIDVSDDDAPELEEVFVTSEPVDGPPIDLAEVARRRAALDAEEEEAASEPPPPGPEPAPEDPALTEQEKATEARVHAIVAEAETKDRPAAFDAPPPPLDVDLVVATLAQFGASKETLADVAGSLRPGGATEPPPGPAVDLRALVEDHVARGESLAGLDLRGADLRDLDLHEQDLGGCDLEGAKLDRADLRGATLTEVRLENASLRDAKLDGAILDKSDLQSTDLRGASLVAASLEAVEAREALFDGAVLRGALVQDAVFSQCRFEKANLEAIEGESADFTASVLDGATFAGAKLPQVRLYDVKGAKVLFDRADLTGARAERAHLTASSLRDVLASGSVWERADVTTSTFQGADLTEASFVRALGLKTNFNEALLVRARLRKARLAGAHFVRADLREADLQKADLELADLRGANLHTAFLERTRLRHAKTDQAIVTQTLLDRRLP